MSGVFEQMPKIGNKSGNSILRVFSYSGIDVMEGAIFMEFVFASYNEFLEEYKPYRFDKCSNCNGICEIVEDDITCIIENRILHFVPLLVLLCV